MGRQGPGQGTVLAHAGVGFAALRIGSIGPRRTTAPRAGDPLAQDQVVSHKCVEMLAHGVGMLTESFGQHLHPHGLTVGLHVLQDPGLRGRQPSLAHWLRATFNIHGIQCNKTLEEPR